MKRSSIVCQVAAPVLMLAMIGCSGQLETSQTDAPAATQPTTTPSDTPADTVPGDGEGVTLVSLKVPNMH
ncbi:hypothetical protein [Planctomycetes bacterium K23_9]|uniref:Uncharacterized protein n=1 Tax=Stieleria marina TaxID=1930275 RepID=A0A517P0A8_9BACT|nr:hypothetical protein K239x_48200 [Planctomycetes bacterium K23_9]